MKEKENKDIKKYKPGLKRDVDKDLVSRLSDEEKIKLTIDGYNSVAGDWDKTRQNFWPELMLEIKKNIKNNSKILDFGCGNGRILKELEVFGLQYFGIDPAGELIKIANEKYGEIPNVKFEVFDGTNLNSKINKKNINLKDDTFDQVISIAVMHHIPPKKINSWLSEAYRVTKKNSISIFTTWNLSESAYDLDKNNDAIIGFIHHKNVRYVHYYSYKNIKNIFEEAGYSILEIKDIKRESGMSNTLIIVQK